MAKKITLYGWKLPIVAVIGLIFSTYFVLSRPASQAKEPHVPPPQASYDASIAGIGVVEPKSELISIGTELPGIIRTVHVKVGDNVKVGAPLFSLDDRDINAQIKKLEAALASAKIAAEDASAQFAIVSSMDDKRAVAKDDFNRRKFGKQLAASKVDEIAAQLALAKTTKERLTIAAPIDGQILEVNVRPGEYANVGVATAPLIRMGDVSVLHVRVEIDEENAALINDKTGAKGFRRGDTANPIPLTFVRFEPYVRPKQNLAVSGQRVDTRVLQVIYALPQGQASTFVGQQMDVFIENISGAK